MRARNTGWDEATWNEWEGAEAPPSCSMSWKELSSAEQHAAQQLGYDAESWDADDTYDQRQDAQGRNWWS